MATSACSSTRSEGYPCFTFMDRCWCTSHHAGGFSITALCTIADGSLAYHPYVCVAGQFL
jgi:hypothetical protein